MRQLEKTTLAALLAGAGGRPVWGIDARGRGGRVAAWGRRENVLMHHPRVVQADDLAGAVALLGSVPAGAGAGDVGTN